MGKLAQRYRNSFQPDLYHKLISERERAEAEQREMKGRYQFYVLEQEANPGLIIERAEYGIGEHVMNCTIPVQMMVYEGRLDFEMTRLGNEPGFYDPIPWNTEKRVLMIKYKSNLDGS